MHIVLFMSFIYLLRLFLGDGSSSLQGDRLCMISVQILVSSSTFDSLRSGYSQPQSQPMPSTNPEGQRSWNMELLNPQIRELLGTAFLAEFVADIHLGLGTLILRCCR